MDILTKNIYTEDTATDDSFLHRLFEHQAKLTPDVIAVKFGSAQLTYAELNEKADALAKAIISFTPHSLAVGVSTHRCIETMVSVMAVLKAGKAYLPLDPSYPKDRLDAIISDSGIDTCLAVEAQRGEFAGLPVQVLASDAAHSITTPATQNIRTRVAYVIYTSGSTGKPKGVCVGHVGPLNLVQWHKKHSKLQDGDRTLQFAPLSFDESVKEIFCTILIGGTLVLVDNDTRLDPTRLIRYVDEQQINRMILPFVALQYFTEAADADKLFPKSLLEFITAGEQLKNTPQIIRFFAALPNCDFYNMYGPTEASVTSTSLWLQGPPEEWPLLPTIGKAIENTEMFILDEQLNYIPEGEVGELCISGINLAEGYLNRPELTAEKFVETWESQPGTITRIYRSGDLCRFLPDGNIEYLGRKDTQVKIRGNRVEIGEIEVLLNQLHGIKQSVVIAREDTPGDKRLVAYLVSANGKKNTAVVREGLEQKLPDYMWPSAFVWLDVLPKTTSGKVDRNALPKPDLKRPDLPTLYRPASTKTQQLLTAIWMDLLQLEQIGVDDNFFDLGGNSLLGLKTVTALKKQHELVLPITKLYQYPTIAGIAAFLDGADKPKERPAPKARVKAGSGDVAVIGMAGRFPGANTIDELWRLLTEGRETTKFFTDNELDPFIPPQVRMAPNYVKARGVIDNADQFDPQFFGLNPKVAELMDPQQRVFLEIAWEALESTGHLPSRYDGLVGVFAGCGNNTYYINNVLPNQHLIDNVGGFLVTTVNEKDYIASRTAYELDLKGPAISVHSACSTSLLAVAEAVESIRSGQCNVALAGGASITSPINSGHLYQEGTMLSADGHCRSFDASSDGTVFSDGAGVVLLKSLEEAIEDGDTIYSVIKGVGLNNDGRDKGSFTAPNAGGQAGAIAMAIQNAGVSAADISYVEAHGTATVLGDPIEIEGLTMAFGPQEKNQYCAIGSIKSNMGHLTAAAGVAGLIKATLALYHKKIPASINFTTPNPNIDFQNSPFYVNTALMDWEAENRIAGVSSFGVGGTNVHVVLQEHLQEAKPTTTGRDLQLFTWSAKTDESLQGYRGKLASYLTDERSAALADVAYTLQTTRHNFAHRAFAIAGGKDELTGKLQIPADKASVNKISAKAADIAFMFPGQGAQYLNMGRELYAGEPVFRSAVDECVALLKGTAQQNILDIIFSDDKGETASEALKNTLNTQPALFIISYAMAKLWISWGVEPSVFLGHSIGEFVAGYFAGIFTLPDAIKLISTRAEMVSELPTGSMVSVRLSENELKQILPATLSIAVVNGSIASVAAGPHDEVDKFVELLNQKNIANRVLQTSHAFHSGMMDPIVAPFEDVVKTITLNKPVKPIISTITGNWMSEAEATDPAYWANHLRNTVRFADMASLLINENFIALEVGPGKVLATLVKQQAGNKTVIAIPGIETTKDSTTYSSVLKAMGQLWINGIEPNWKAFYAGQNRLVVNAPTYAYNRKRCWVDPVAPINTVTPPFEAPTEIFFDHPQETPPIMANRKAILIEKLKEVFEVASGIDIDSTDTGFVEAGFDSLLLTQIATNLKKEFNVPITFRKLFEDYNTLNLLSDYLDGILPAGEYQSAVAATAVQNGQAQPVYQHTNYQQPVYQNGHAPVIANGGNPALTMIAQQLQLLASQVATLQGGGMPVVKQTELILPPPPAHAFKTHERVTAPVAPASLQPELTPEEQIEIKKPFGATAKIEKHITGLNDKQQAFLNKLTAAYNAKTKGSKEQTQQHRPYMADPRVVSGFKPLTKEIVYPIVVNRSKGCRLWDVDGNEYVDALNGFGSNMLGYQPDVLKDAIAAQLEKGYEIGPQHELAGEVCKTLCEFTGFDRAALCSTGSEAVLGAMRIARTVTGRSIIVAFSGSYHGIMDEVIVRGTKKLRTVPAAPGIMPESVQNMLILDYGTDETLRIIEERKDEIAAVLVEVVQSRRPEYLPLEFLRKLRDITAEAKTALIFDEVITGFRMHPGGIQAITGIRADLGTYGKVIGGGLPVGAIIGKKEYMDALDGGTWQFGDDSGPDAGVTYFAGTFVRHPLALAAVKASLQYMKDRGPALQQGLTDKAKRLTDALNEILEQHKTPMYVANFGSLWKVKYHEEFPYSELIFTNMRLRGVHIMDGFPCFMTDAHTDADVDFIIDTFAAVIAEMVEAEFIPTYTQTTMAAPVSASAVNELGEPPVPGAKLGRDSDGNPGWFISDDNNPGKYLQVKQKAN